VKEALPETPVRVLWLIKGLGPGGAEQLLVNHAMVRDAERLEFEAAYLVPWKDHLVGRLEASGVTTTCLDGAHEWDLRWAVRLRLLLRHRRFDVVHAHSPYFAGIVRLLLRTLAKASRPALVYTEHNRWPRHSRPTRVLNRLTMGLDDVDLAVSEDVRSTIPPKLATRVEVVEHGVEVEVVRSHRPQRAAVRNELGIDGDEIVIGTVANFRREKAYENLLEAAARALAATDLPLRFVAVGQGPLEDEIHAHHQRLGLDDRFLLLGYREDAIRIMAAFDIFTLSSRHEGLPVALMDALALELPVVATSVGGIPQAVTDGVEARLVPADDPQALAGAYLAVAADAGLRQTMAEAAARRAHAFDISAAARHLETCYLELAARRVR
jgi:glycosyltransferase involved in cell wall biosynthesis